MDTGKKLIEKETEIYYRISGNGNPVVLVHGFAEDGTIWENQSLHLEKSCQLIIPDIPGSGRSILKKKDPSLVDFADDLKLILDQEKIETCTMIGHSMGGYITLAFAEKYANSLTSFGLFHSSAYADDEEKKTSRLKNIDFIAESGATKFLKQSIPNLFHTKFKYEHPDILRNLIKRFTNFSPDSLVKYLKAMMHRPDRTPVLKKFKGPVLFIIGEHDTAVPLQHSLQQCHTPELSYIHICKNSGHMGMIEEAGFCNEAIVNFLVDR